jgi:hypothetical protein
MTNSRFLFEAYESTSFFADVPDRICIRIDERNTDLEALLEARSVRSWAYLTAFNPSSNLLSAEENERRQRELEEVIAKTCRLFYRGEGIGDDGVWPGVRPPKAERMPLGEGARCPIRIPCQTIWGVRLSVSIAFVLQGDELMNGL